MRVVIVARRERPITRAGQVEKVLDKLEIGPVSHARPELGNERGRLRVIVQHDFKLDLTPIVVLAPIKS